MTTDLAEVEHADLVVESLPEDADVKQAVLAPLAVRFMDATFASDTSSLSDSGLADELRRDRSS